MAIQLRLSGKEKKVKNICSIDVAIAFNEINFQDRSVGYVRKRFLNKPLTYVDQIVAFKKSVHKNWSSFKGNVYALHSEPLSEISRKRLKESGVLVKFMRSDRIKGFICNKITAYENFSSADLYESDAIRRDFISSADFSRSSVTSLTCVKSSFFKPRISWFIPSTFAFVSPTETSAEARLSVVWLESRLK